MTRRTSLFALAAGAVFVAPPASAQDPEAMPDESQITLGGTVVEATPDNFMLDYGDGVITVDMNKFGRYDTLYQKFEGARVTVYGEIDRDLFEEATIDARSVYAENLNTFIVADPKDDMEGVIVMTPVVVAQVALNGIVTGIDQEERELMLESGGETLRIETEFLGYNPLDDKGFQQLDTGDRVSVTGYIDRDFLEGRVIEAETVVTLQGAGTEDDGG